MTALPRPRRIRVVVVDDSALMRDMLSRAISADPTLEVVGVAGDPYQARELIKATNPDVVTLDVEMPRMDGLTFLDKIMSLRPMPVIMVSTLTQQGSDATIRALELGAIDCVAKPSGLGGASYESLCEELPAKIHIAATARVSQRRASPPAARLSAPRRRGDKGRMIAIGASTGGVERIRELLQAIPGDAPPIAITQHMGSNYLASFAARLDTLSAAQVRLAGSGLRLVPGLVVVAPGEGHLAIARDGQGLYCRIDDGPPVSGHRPSVDVLFRSVAEAAGTEAVGVILSGMGRDGAAGMAELRATGAYTIGEQETSCVVYGMPRVARELGGVCQELPIGKIAAAMLQAFDTVGDRSSLQTGA